jgi:GrpB-like predicted nucleotidyltransferase (UPF0157 family)
VGSAPVEVVAYDPAWPERFRQIAAPLRAALGNAALRIDHIGSTSVPGLDAKPIVDLQISVAALEPMRRYRGPLERLGYRWREDNPDLSKRYFREGEGEPRTHIHVREAGSLAEQLALAFRDYLRVHEEDARAYAVLKHSLAVTHRRDRAGYTDAKEPFVWEVMKRASRWTQEIGWRAGPSDA